MPAMLDRLNRQMTEAQERYRSIEALIASEDRDPSEIEQGEMTSLRERMTALVPQINEHVTLERSLNESASAMASLPASAPGRPSTAPVGRSDGRTGPADVYRSWGDFAQAELTSEQRDAIHDVMLAYEIEHSRALVDMTTADVPGLVPPVWIRTIADTISAAQPFISAFSSMALPDVGMTLTYPQITARPLVGKQSAEKTDVPSRKSHVGNSTAPVVTYGGGEDISVQVIQRTDPAYLSLMLDLYAEAMAIVCNTDAITAALAAIATAAVDLGTPTTFATNLAKAAAQVLTQSRLMADTFVVSTDIWQAFAGAVDPNGRPLFPNTAPSNPVGSTSLDSVNGNARGLAMVVDPMMPAGTGVLGYNGAFTSLLGAVQTLSADNVSKLGRDYAVFRFAAFISRRPDAMVKVTFTPPVGP